jgi:hypothetical protein
MARKNQKSSKSKKMEITEDIGTLKEVDGVMKMVTLSETGEKYWAKCDSEEVSERELTAEAYEDEIDRAEADSSNETDVLLHESDDCPDLEVDEPEEEEREKSDLEEIVEEEEKSEPEEEVPKKKRASKKKTPTKEEEVPKKKRASKKKTPTKEEKSEEDETEPEEEVPKKKRTSKKKTQAKEEKSDEDETEPEEEEPTKGKKKTTKKKKDDKNEEKKPKRSMNAYNYYVRVRMTELKEEIEDSKLRFSTAAKSWKELSDGEKAKYKEACNKYILDNSP